MTQVKIKINDNKKVRNEINNLYLQADQILAVEWSIEIAKHILEIANIDYYKIPEIIEGFRVNLDWPNNRARISDIRRVGFTLHKLARAYSNDEIKKYALRVVGQAVSSGHMKEHAMIASDYAIKFINIIYPNDLEKVNKERNWQLKELKKIIEIK